jgi:hypothetical protein
LTDLKKEKLSNPEDFNVIIEAAENELNRLK